MIETTGIANYTWNRPKTIRIRDKMVEPNRTGSDRLVNGFGRSNPVRAGSTQSGPTRSSADGKLRLGTTAAADRRPVGGTVGGNAVATVARSVAGEMAGGGWNSGEKVGRR